MKMPGTHIMGSTAFPKLERLQGSGSASGDPRVRGVFGRAWFRLRFKA